MHNETSAHFMHNGVLKHDVWWIGRNGLPRCM